MHNYIVLCIIMYYYFALITYKDIYYIHKSGITIKRLVYKDSYNISIVIKIIYFRLKKTRF